MSKKEQTATSTVVAQINQLNIVGIENGKKQVADKPICKPLVLNTKAQRKKIQQDVIWDLTILQSKAVGTHEKDRDRVTIAMDNAPFTIDFTEKKGGCDE